MQNAHEALARSQVSLAEAAYREHDGRAMLKVLGSVPEDLRDNDWRYLHGRADTTLARVILPPGQLICAAVAHPTRPVLGLSVVPPLDGPKSSA